MRNQDMANDAHPVESLMNKHCLPGGRSVGRAVRPIAPAMARAINQNDAVIRSQPITESQPHIPEIGTGTMQQHQWRRIGAAQFDDVQSAAVDVHEPS